MDLDFEILEKKEMPINLFPKFFSYFFLLYYGKIVEDWCCVDKRNFLAVM
ncbi:MAG: hypothetical protein ACKVLD_03445 [Flavobacteriales bacterium]